MSFINLTTWYLLWHYTRAFSDFFRIWKDMLWFCIHFFSLPNMVHTLFSPWKRMSEEKAGGIEGFFSSLIVNIIMRVIGFFMRSILIIIGVLSLVVVFILGIIMLLIWIFAPFIILVIFVNGIGLLFS